MFVLFLKILGGIAALALGFYLGMGRGFEPDRTAIEEALGEKGRSKKVRRHWTFLNMFKKSERASDVRRRSQKRKPFQLDR